MNMDGSIGGWTDNLQTSRNLSTKFFLRTLKAQRLHGLTSASYISK